MNESWTLGISRRYRLEELIGLDQIKQYLSRVSVPCSILDVDGRWVGEPPAHHDLCRLITESVDGRGACAGCLGKRMQAADSIDGPLVHECLVGLYSCIAAVRVVDEVVGYVAGPIFLREPLTSIQVATLRDVEKENSLDELLPPSQEDSVTEAVLKLSRQIGRRCASERGLRLLNEGTRRLAGVMSTIEAQGTLIETADAFFNRATVAVYQPTSDGVLQLCRVQPARATWQVENRIRFGEGPVGLAAATRPNPRI
jgi:ligand-binding sensor protein